MKKKNILCLTGTKSKCLKVRINVILVKTRHYLQRPSPTCKGIVYDLLSCKGIPQWFRQSNHRLKRADLHTPSLFDTQINAKTWLTVSTNRRA